MTNEVPTYGYTEAQFSQGASTSALLNQRIYTLKEDSQTDSTSYYSIVIQEHYTGDRWYCSSHKYIRCNTIQNLELIDYVVSTYSNQYPLDGQSGEYYYVWR